MSNGLFTIPQEQLEKSSWELLLRKKSESGNIEIVTKLNPSEEVIKALREQGVFD